MSGQPYKIEVFNYDWIVRPSKLMLVPLPEGGDGGEPRSLKRVIEKTYGTV